MTKADLGQAVQGSLRKVERTPATIGRPNATIPNAASATRIILEKAKLKGGELLMAKRTNSEVTSKKAASAASKVLRDPKASKAAKSAAGSALTQRPNRKK